MSYNIGHTNRKESFCGFFGEQTNYLMPLRRITYLFDSEFLEVLFFGRRTFYRMEEKPQTKLACGGLWSLRFNGINQVANISRH
mmetsp:Transcript_35472/g.74844  ORF Transcript_35472/g.74844 Transcript_35472/m.74844 type:complete len:84 (+) Transcript_35472:640-891(+)